MRGNERSAWEAAFAPLQSTGRAARSGPPRSERAEQADVFTWAKEWEHVYPVLRLMFGTMNAGRRTGKGIGFAKATGLKAGVPDILLPVPINPYAGLAIEMKVKGNQVTDPQKFWLGELGRCGWRAVVCWSAEEAIREIRGYVDLPSPSKIPASGAHSTQAQRAQGSSYTPIRKDPETLLGPENRGQINGGDDEPLFFHFP